VSNESDEEFYERFSKGVEEERGRIEVKERKAANGKADKETETQAQTLTKISTSGAVLFHAPDGTGYADIVLNGHRETWPIRSKGFRGWLTREFYKRDGAVPNSNALQAALALIEAIARFDGPEQKVFVRVASDNGKLYLDLADPGWNAIEIDAMGWRLVPEPPVRFRRAAGMLPLPIPEHGGKIDGLRRFLNVRDENDFVLAVAWLLAALRDVGPYPVLALLGVHGAAKSSFTSILRSLVDPNTAPLRALPREDRDLFIAASNGHVLAFDNVSSMPNWVSDTLCRLATGGGFAVRQLYTDQDEVLFDSCRPIILNGIEDFITRPDLADRTMFEALQAIPEKNRKASQQLMAEFERERPKILGALLTAVSCGLKRLPNVKLERLPRMADFAKWATACELALWPAGTFEKAYDANRAEAVETVIEADPVATALRSFMEDKTEWAGTPSDLLGQLSHLVPEPERRGGNTWPAASNKLTGRLRRQVPFLRQIGIHIDERREGKDRTRRLYIRREERVRNQPPAPSAPSAKGDGPSSGNGLAADDKADDSPSADGNVVPIGRPNLLKVKPADEADDKDGRMPPSSPCAHCGQRGGEPWNWLDREIPLHPHCADTWAEAQTNQRLRAVRGSSQ
jgi:hypothetical protein